MTAIDQLVKGDQVFETTFSITRESLVRYAGASGDFNAVHYRDDAAQALGLDGVVAHGMLTAALAINTVVAWAGDPGVVAGYETRFARPVLVGLTDPAEITLIGTVGKVDEDTVRVDVKVLHAGQQVLTATRVTIRKPVAG